MNEKKIKIHNSKGKLYYICPFLDRIEVIITDKLSSEDIFEIIRHTDSIREIARNLRGEDVCCGDLNYERIHSPYKLSALIKQFKLYAKAGVLTEEKIDELTKLYF